MFELALKQSKAKQKKRKEVKLVKRGKSKSKVNEIYLTHPLSLAQKISTPKHPKNSSSFPFNNHPSLSPKTRKSLFLFFKERK
jgi:hypothetical protein